MNKKEKLILPFPYFLWMLGTKPIIFKEETELHGNKKTKEILQTDVEAISNGYKSQSQKRIFTSYGLYIFHKGSSCQFWGIPIALPSTFGYCPNSFWKWDFMSFLGDMMSINHLMMQIS